MINLRLVTSQNDAAPKRASDGIRQRGCLVTSQNDAAPKQNRELAFEFSV